MISLFSNLGVFYVKIYQKNLGNVITATFCYANTVCKIILIKSHQIAQNAAEWTPNFHHLQNHHNYGILLKVWIFKLDVRITRMGVFSPLRLRIPFLIKEYYRNMNWVAINAKPVKMHNVTGYPLRIPLSKPSVTSKEVE